MKNNGNEKTFNGYSIILVLSSAHRVGGGDFMEEVFRFILAVVVQSKPLRLGEEW